jgi:tetratricopeptide (TPR) repeat protein
MTPGQDQLLEELHRLNEALNDDSTAIRIKPLVSWYYRDRAYTLDMLDRIPDAVKDCTTAINIMKNEQASYYSESTDIGLAKLYTHRSKFLKRIGKRAAAQDDLAMAVSFRSKRAAAKAY